MHDYPDRYEPVRRARELLQRLDDADREAALERQLRDPAEDLDRVEPMPVADWRTCKTTKAMTTRQFNAWCDAGKPALENPVAPHDRVLASKVDALVRTAVDRERTNTQASFEAFAEIMGEEVAIIENKLRADFKAEIEALRAAKVARPDFGDEVLELPDWKSFHVEH
jgi:hypothetical protein